MGSIYIFKPLSTFLYPALLINLSNADNFSSEFVLETVGIEPWAAGWEASMLPLSYAASQVGFLLAYLCMETTSQAKKAPNKNNLVRLEEDQVRLDEQNV